MNKNRLKIRFNDIIFKWLSFFVGGAEESLKSKRMRLFLYFFMVVVANVALGKNIGNDSYPWYANVSIFLLLNINIILILLLFILLFRNFTKLMADRRQRIFGSKIQTKLAIFAVILVVLPAATTYFISSTLISKSIDRWFDSNVYKVYSDSTDLSSAYEAEVLKKITKQVRGMSKEFKDANDPTLEAKLTSYVNNGFFTSLAVYNRDGTFLKIQNTPDNYYTFLSDELLGRLIKGNTDFDLYRSDNRSYFWSASPLYDENSRVVGVLFGITDASSNVLQKAKDISGNYKLFKQLRFYSLPVGKAFAALNILVVVLVIFACIWGSMIFVRGISNPLKQLGKAAGEISKGNLAAEVPVEGNDEITYLSRSFNNMAQKLRSRSLELHERNSELNLALEQISKDKSYIDIIYKNVDSAVFLFDLNLNILKMNSHAETFITGIATNILGKYSEDLNSFMSGMEQEHVRSMLIPVNGENREYAVHVNKVFNTEGVLENIIIVLDDNTHLINLQRITLWKEIATRITHEIKNPLTPIKLTAERVRRRSKEIPVLQTKEFVDSSMNTIIDEVDELISMVEEFNMFARMPSAVRNDLCLLLVVNDVINLLSKEKLGNISVNISEDIHLNADRNQMKRVFLNLIQNAYQALHDKEGGSIAISGEYREELLTMVIEDNGEGIEEMDLPNVFYPYFSKKPDGTGLGLSIVKKIVEEHGGTISVDSCKNQYTKFIIKIPAFIKKADIIEESV